MTPGDHLVQPPGCTVENHGAEDLLYYVIADNPASESVFYPDAQKMATWPPYRLFRMTPAEYFEDEE